MKAKNAMKIFVLALSLGVVHNADAQINLNKVKNKVKVPKAKKQNSSSQEATNEGSGNASSDNASSGSAKMNAASYYDEKRKFIDRNLANISVREWTEDFLEMLEQADIPGLEAKMKEDEEKFGKMLMLYPKKLPTSGMGAITQKNLDKYSFARIADANAEPPTGDAAQKMLKFYNEYCFMKEQLVNGGTDVAASLRKSIQEADNAHPLNQFNYAKLAKRQAETAAALMPDNMRITDLRDEAVNVYKGTIAKMGKMITGPFHEANLQNMVVFSKNPSFGSENEADLVDVIIPGEEAYITGYFAMTNKTAGGIPSLLLINPENQYAKDKDPWGHGNESQAAMFNGQAVKDVYYDKAYFTFNLFPNLETVDYKTHVGYMPHLNLLKWLMYLPSEVVEIPVRYGRSNKVAVGRIKVDLSGDNKAKLKTYYEALKQKHLNSVTFPDLAGCSEAKSKVHNYSDLSKYGKVLRMTLTQTGDIMKPWPNDDQVEYNTAAGYAAVEKESGKVEVMPLSFRKAPTESSWQWWSVGSIPDLYPLYDQGSTINAVKKLEYGYEILPENVSKCSYWYDQQ